MALLTGVLVSVTELIKMHMFGIIHRLSLPGRGETTRQIYVNYQPVSLSLMGTRVTQENCFSLCIIKSHHKNKDERGGLTEYSEGVVSLKGKGNGFMVGSFLSFFNSLGNLELTFNRSSSTTWPSKPRVTLCQNDALKWGKLQPHLPSHTYGLPSLCRGNYTAESSVA